MISGIYQIKNKVNNKIYIGKSKDIEGRWQCHFRLLESNRHYNDHLQNAYNRYGADNFETAILYYVDEDKLDVAEMCAIYTFGSDQEDKGYNLTIGGDGVNYSLLTEETKIKRNKAVSDALIGRKLSDEHKENMFHQGMLGKKHSEESKKKMSDALVGRDVWNKGLTLADERVSKNMTEKAKSTQFKSGFVPWNKGLKYSLKK